MRQSVGQQLSNMAYPHRPTGDQIAQRAYEIYERDGRPWGKDREHWHRAEMELLAEFQTRQQVQKEAGLVTTTAAAGPARLSRRTPSTRSAERITSAKSAVAPTADAVSTTSASAAATSEGSRGGSSRRRKSD